MQAEDVKKLEGSPELSEIWHFCPMGNQTLTLTSPCNRMQVDILEFSVHKSAKCFPSGNFIHMSFSQFQIRSI